MNKPENKIVAGAREALTVARGEAHAARTTFLLEFSPGKSVKIIISGDLDDEVLDAVDAYSQRQRDRIRLLPQS